MSELSFAATNDEDLTMKNAGILGLGIALAITMSPSVNALDVSTHRLINVAATGKETLDDYSNTFDGYLRISLGLANGREAILHHNGRPWIAEQWLAEGGQREDDGSPFSVAARFYRHFHNPLLPWADAGLLTRFPFHLLPHQYTSSVRWMQTENQSADDGAAMGGEWSWQRARKLHYLVLTTDDPGQRERYAADLFRALGQVMHLVVDASVPEHVRNDPHPFGTLVLEVLRSRKAGNYEYWVSERQAQLGDEVFAARYLSRPIGPDAQTTTIAAPADDAVARVPVARLIDADRYVLEAPDPNVTLSGPVGLAEFANANFFSEDTLSGADTQGRRLPFPRREDLVRRVDRAPSGSGARAYFEKPAGQGLVTKFALAECRLQGRAAALPPYPCMDEAVWEETSAHMLPRAVGYARAVLDHFFRARLGVQTSRMRLGTASIRIDNLTDEEMTGVFEVFARPNAQTSDEGREPTALVNGGAPATIGPFRSAMLPITYLQAEPTPFQMLVFRGRIGLEDDAVAAQTFTVHHLMIAQTAHIADLSEKCTITVNSSKLQGPESEVESCAWLSVRQQTDGELIAGGSTPVARVSVSAHLTETELVLDGAPAPAGVWQRQGDEPNPRRFSVRWARQMGTVVGQPLPTLTVQLVDGTVSTARIYGSIVARGEAEKSYTRASTGSEPPWYVAVTRSATVWVAPPAVASLPSYRVASISGHPNPTYVTTDRFGVPALVESLEAHDSLFGNIPGYDQRWTDHATVYWTAPARGPAVLWPRLKEEYDGLSYGPVPRPSVEAVLERTFRPGELDFLRAFVTRKPPPTILTVVGRRSGT